MISITALRQQIQDIERQAGEALVRMGRVRELRRGAGWVEYLAGEEPASLVRLQQEGDSRCDCGQTGGCRHLLAALMAAEDSGVLRELSAAQQKQLSRDFYDAVDTILPRTADLSIEPSVLLSPDGLRIGLRAGEDRLYVVKNLPQFLLAVRDGEAYPLAPGLTLQPRWSSFSPQDGALLRLLLQQVETLQWADAKLTAPQARSLPLPPEAAQRLLRALAGLRFRLTDADGTRLQPGIALSPLPAVFYVSGGLKDIRIQARFDAPITAVDAECSHLLIDGVLTRLHRLDRPLARVLLSSPDNSFVFAREDIPRVTAELLPTLMHRHAVVFTEELERRLIRLPLTTRIYLDQAGKDIMAKLRFVYGDIELDPFSVEESPRLLLHDAPGERKVLEAMADAGFRVRKGYVVLSGEERIYRFLVDKLQALGQVAELYLSQSFKKLAPRTAALSGRLAGGPEGLRLQLMDDGQPVEDLLPLLQAIRSRKQYFRYRDGSFITLEDSAAWQDLAEAALEAAREQPELRDLKAYRASYLNALVEASQLPVAVEEGVQQLLEPAPVLTSPVEGLHAYQVRGFEWLAGLHHMRMGGILADEMGLGKTVQAIAAILHTVRTEPVKRPSIVVAPTSLCYNWLREFKRFAPSLKVQVAEGTAQRRRAMITDLQGKGAPDVLITSYPLIRQDIDLLREIPFRFAVLDEAQFIKNTLSLSARAAKRLQAEVRLALSGTPMENNVAELWSLFDFVLPGYLPPLREFLRRYDQGRNAQDLLRRIRPFLMRRLKSEVMAELPPKIETQLTVPMPDDQRRVYRAVLNQRRIRLESMLEGGTLHLGRGEVLSALTELRQICCHPALVLPGYSGDSGKVDLLLDILPDALEGGHRVLIFSQFTQMLKILKRQLELQGMDSLYLDGDTPPQERLQLCERFNAGHEPIFLISLKAGGTGLNLTGADMVIHYDPWWNPSAEDQAADRAHRLGQEKPVQVLRLVMQDSIEEKVLELGRSKRKLFEQLITPGEALPQKLKPEEILRLFQQDKQGIDARADA